MKRVKVITYKGERTSVRITVEVDGIGRTHVGALATRLASAVMLDISQESELAAVLANVKVSP